MKNHAAILTPSVSSIIRVAAVLFLCATPLMAQGNPSFPQPATKENPRTNPAEFNGRNENITLLERGKDEAQRRQLVMSQMNEDFEKIQSADKDILSAVSTNDVPDYKRIVDGLADINKRAIRLKNNMALPAAAKDDKSQKKREETNVAELRPALIALNDLITNFVTSPLFRKEASVDTSLLARARRDLEGIIDLSDKVKKNVEKTSKAAAAKAN